MTKATAPATSGRTNSRMLRALPLLIASVFMTSLASPSNATTTPAPTADPTVSGKVTNLKGKLLAEATCLYFWAKDVSAPLGWADSNDCVFIDERGTFEDQLPVGDYKVEVEATNVVRGMFVGGADVTKATTISVPAKGLKGLALKVNTMATVSGKVVDLKGQEIINANCVNFWSQSPSSPTTWTKPLDCAEMDFDGSFTAYVLPGKYKIEVLADNVALHVFVGGDNTLANASVVNVPAEGLSKLLYKMPVQPEFGGKIVGSDGLGMVKPDALYIWGPDAKAASGWSLTGDVWDIDKRGNFHSYLIPGPYKLEFAYGTPSVRKFFGGSSVQTATVFTMPANGMTGAVIGLGLTQPPATPASVQTATADKAVSVAWSHTNIPGAMSYAIVTATPGGATCMTTALQCTVSGLKNGTTYNLSLAFVGDGGTAVSSLGTFTPNVPVFTATPDTRLVNIGATVTLAISNAGSNGRIAIAGKPGILAQVVSANPLGYATATIKIVAAGVTTVTLKSGKLATTATMFVPIAKWATSAKRGKATALSVAAAPAGAAVVFTFTDGSKLSGIATAKNAFAGSLTFTKAGTYTGTVTVNGISYGTSTIVVS